MGIDFNDAEDIDPELLEQAKKGETTMKNTASTDNESLKISGGGGGGGDLPFDEVLQKSQNDLTKVKQIISQGGFTGPEKDKYEMSLHHAEWVQSRNLYMKCDNDIKEKSVKYVTLDKGKAQNHEIMKAHKEWTNTREICKKSSSDLLERANKYVETDRRARANKKAEGEFYPSLSQKVEGFIGTESIKEGFDFYNGGSKYNENNPVVVSGSTAGGVIIPAVMTFNARLPLYTDTQRTTTDNKNTLPWLEYYTECSGVSEYSKKLCENANIQKNNYIMTINQLFDRADRLLNTYYKVVPLTGTQNNEKINEVLLNDSNIKSVMENQKKNIALYKQNALYDYEEYSSLSFYEDLVGFLYYAVFVIFAVMSLRDFFASASGAYDKRNIIILILLGIYPKYILPVVLWILNGLTKIMEILGVKNVRFWGA
jgi:hypothetical protein